MSKFHVGEIAIISPDQPDNVCSDDMKKYRGEEVEVININVNCDQYWFANGLYHEVRHADGVEAYIKQKWLRKLPPHTDPSTWEELKDIYEPKELIA